MIVYAGKRPQAIRSHPGASRYPLSLPGNDSDVNDRLPYDAQSTRKAPSDEGAVAAGD